MEPPTLCMMLEISHNIADLFKSAKELDFHVLRLKLFIDFFLISDLTPVIVIAPNAPHVANAIKLI